jgi:flagellar protein FliS
MRSQQRALNSYGSVQVVTGVASANNVQLIQMLFDGLIESLAKAKGHMVHGTIKEKSDALGRAGRIVVGLQGALDFKQGGDLAQNLNELYAYVTRRLFHINAHNDLEALDEVFVLMNDIRQAWNTLPTLMADTAPSVRYAN